MINCTLVSLRPRLALTPSTLWRTNFRHCKKRGLSSVKLILGVIWHGLGIRNLICQFLLFFRIPGKGSKAEGWHTVTNCRPESTCPPEWSEANEPDPSDEEIWQALYSLAADFVHLARKYGVKVVVLQPLNQFDGWPAGTERAEWVRRKAERWLPLCSKLGVEFLQVCFSLISYLVLAPLRDWTNNWSQVGSNDWVDACAPDAKTAGDMRWIAELGARQDPPVKIAYEPWCFSDLRGEWEECYKTVQQAVRLPGQERFTKWE